MSNTAISRWLVKGALAGVLSLAAMPVPALAQDAERAHSAWMAASSHDASLNGPTWGRLTMTADYLIFRSTSYEWNLPLAEVKRISSSHGLAFVVEGVAGERYYVGILNGQLTFTSPSRAMQMIRRAVRDAPSSTSSRPTMVAGGGGQR